MVAVAIGWQVYSIRHSAFDLGLIGLAEFLPLPLLALPAGALADRISRRLIFAGSLALNVAVTVALLLVTLSGPDRLWPFIVLAVVSGIASAVGNPAGRALGPTLVPIDLLPSALALRSLAFQIGTVAGPALGGLVFSFTQAGAYGLAIALLLISVAATLAMHEGAGTTTARSAPPGLAALMGGIHFIRRTPVMLGAITLDLFAVLFGGAVALLPLFAKSILHVGPFGLGVLRAAPAVGAIAAGVMLARKPLRHHAGRTLLVVVALFGVSMIVFGFSRWFPLSLAALAMSGFVDMISMNIRATITALAPSDELRGRVVAVEMVFISASNELGAFESGAAAALLGAVPAVVIGGAITILVALAARFVFPALATINRLEDLAPKQAGPDPGG